MTQRRRVTGRHAAGAVAALCATASVGASTAQAVATPSGACKFPSRNITWSAQPTLTGRALTFVRNQATWTSATTNVKLTEVASNGNFTVGVGDIQFWLRRPAGEVGATEVWCGSGPHWAQAPRVWIDSEFINRPASDAALSSTAAHEIGHALGLLHHNETTNALCGPNFPGLRVPTSVMGNYINSKGQVCGPTALNATPDKDKLNLLYK